MHSWKNISLLGVVDFSNGIGLVVKFDDSDDTGIVGFTQHTYRGKNSTEVSFLTNAPVKVLTITCVLKLIDSINKNAFGKGIDIPPGAMRLYTSNGIPNVSIRDDVHAYFTDINFLIRTCYYDHEDSYVWSAEKHAFESMEDLKFSIGADKLIEVRDGNHIYRIKEILYQGKVKLSFRKYITDSEGRENQSVGSIAETMKIAKLLYVNRQSFYFDSKGDIITQFTDDKANRTFVRKIKDRLSGNDRKLCQDMNASWNAATMRNAFRKALSK